MDKIYLYKAGSKKVRYVGVYANKGNVWFRLSVKGRVYYARIDADSVASTEKEIVVFTTEFSPEHVNEREWAITDTMPNYVHKAIMLYHRYNEEAGIEGNGISNLFPVKTYTFWLDKAD